MKYRIELDISMDIFLKRYPGKWSVAHATLTKYFTVVPCMGQKAMLPNSKNIQAWKCTASPYSLPRLTYIV